MNTNKPPKMTPQQTDEWARSIAGQETSGIHGVKNGPSMSPDEIEKGRRAAAHIRACNEADGKKAEAQQHPQLTDAEMNEMYKAPVGDTEQAKDKGVDPRLETRHERMFRDHVIEALRGLTGDVNVLKNEMMCQRASVDKRSSNEKQPTHITNPMHPGPLMAMPPLYPQTRYSAMPPAHMAEPPLQPFMFGKRQEPQVYTTGNIYQRHETGAPFGQSNQMPKDPIVKETVSQEDMRRSFIDNSVATAKSHKDSAKTSLHEAVSHAFYNVGVNGLITVGSLARLVRVNGVYHMEIHNGDKKSLDTVGAALDIYGAGVTADINNIVDRLFLHL